VKLIQTMRAALPDGTALEAQIDARDFMAYDVARARRNWPPGSEAGFLLMQYLTWNALRRAGDEHVGAHFDVDNPPFADLEEIGNGVEPDPTPPDPGPG
jgi:hypothetical protein